MNVFKNKKTFFIHYFANKDFVNDFYFIKMDNFIPEKNIILAASMKSYIINFTYYLNIFTYCLIGFLRHIFYLIKTRVSIVFNRLNGPSTTLLYIFYIEYFIDKIHHYYKSK